MGEALYAGPSKLPDRLELHIQAAMHGKGDASQRDLHAVIRFQIPVLGHKPMLEKVHEGLSKRERARAREKLLIETTGVQILDTGPLVNTKTKGVSHKMLRDMGLGSWQRKPE